MLSKCINHTHALLTLANSDECGSLKSAHNFGLVLCQVFSVPAKYSSSYPNILATSSSFGFSESMSSLSRMARVACKVKSSYIYIYELYIYKIKTDILKS